MMPPLLDKEGLGVVSKEVMFTCEHLNSSEVPLWSPLAGGRTNFSATNQLNILFIRLKTRGNRWLITRWII